MAKVTGPLLSLGAKGQIAKAVVFARWRGVDYARQHVVPANPQSVEQTKTRDVFRHLEEMWKRVGSLGRATWDLAAKGQKFVGRNKFLSVNIVTLRGQANSQNYVGSPGANGGIVHESLTVADSVTPDSIDITFVAPSPPLGWTLLSGTAQAFKDQIPDGFEGAVDEAGSATPETTFLLPVTGGVGLYVVSAWLTWQKADGSTAYGPSTTTTVTVA